jgi:hypothetical protein
MTTCNKDDKDALFAQRKDDHDDFFIFFAICHVFLVYLNEDSSIFDELYSILNEHSSILNEHPFSCKAIPLLGTSTHYLSIHQFWSRWKSSELVSTWLSY